MICHGCGKPLSAEEMRGDDCPYCGVALPHRAEAIKDTATVKELMRDADGDGIPDIFQGADTEAGEGDESLLHKEVVADSTINWLIFLFVAFVICLVYLYENGYLTDENQREDGVATMASSSEEIKRPVPVLDICMVDANSDGVDDIAVHVGGKSSSMRIVDGVTGKALWTGEKGKKRTHLGCVDKRWVVAYWDNFEFTLYDASEMKAVFSATGSDVVDSAALGDGCIQIKTDDGEFEGYDLNGGASTDCFEETNHKRFRVSRIGVMELNEKEERIAVNETRYDLTVRKRGTKILKLRVSKGDDVLIDRELTYRKPTFSAGIAAGKGMVMIFGATNDDEKKAVLIGIDENTGEERYVHSISKSNHPNNMIFNGQHVLIQHQANLYAHDIETGEQKWVLTD